MEREALLKLVGMGRYDAVTEPVEAACGGCPWKICVALIIAYKCNLTVARKLLGAFFCRWPLPEDVPLKGEEVRAVEQLLMPLNGSYGKARGVKHLTEAWLRGDWETVLDLPGVGVRISLAVKGYAGRCESLTKISKRD